MKARYKAVVDRYAQAIRSGQLPAGSRLPTHRTLAAGERLSLATATRVYRELEEMGIAEQVLEEYEARDEFQDVAEYLVNDGSMCGYLFRCLHCEQFHLWVDAD